MYDFIVYILLVTFVALFIINARNSYKECLTENEEISKIRYNLDNIIADTNAYNALTHQIIDN